MSLDDDHSFLTYIYYLLLVALLVDTSHALGRIHGICPTVLATTTTTNTSTGGNGNHHHHSNIATAVPWMSTRIQLVELSSCSWWLPNNDNNKDCQEVVAMSHWKAERQTVRDGESYNNNNNNNNNKGIVEYVVTKTRDSDTMTIQWKRPRPTPPK
jgi:hypothetical protein